VTDCPAQAGTDTRAHAELSAFRPSRTFDAFWLSPAELKA